MAAPDSTSILQRWTLLQEAAQCKGVLEGKILKYDLKKTQNSIEKTQTCFRNALVVNTKEG